jgi:glycosyltransferase involved in cell wall biosynthesis
MDTTQLSLCYLPITGGQEVYVSQLSALAQQLGTSHIIQAHPRINVKLEENDKERVTLIKIPRGLHRINNILPTLFFRALSRKYLEELNESEKLVLHYGTLFSKTQHPVENTFVVSHGRDWDNSLSGRYRSFKLIDAYKQGCKIICNDLDVSNYLAKSLSLNYIFSKENRRKKRLHYLPNSYDSDMFGYSGMYNETNGYFLVVRNLRKSRGVDLAIKAYLLYRQQGGRKELKIAGGPTSGEYFEYLSNLIRSNNLDKYIEFLGQKNRDEIPCLYRSAALSIVPSVAFEGTSISALESMAVGCPCASTNIGGLQELPTIKFSSLNELASIMHSADTLDRRSTSDSVKNYSSEEWKKQWKLILE